MDNLEKNMKASLGVFTKEFLTDIKNANIPTWCKPIFSDDGTPNLLIKKGGKIGTIYDKAGWIKDIEQRMKELTFPDTSHTLIIGISMGFFIKEALKKSNEHIFIIVEPNLGMIKTAFENCDFSKDIAGKRLFITPTMDDVTFTMEYVNTAFVCDNWEILAESYTVNNMDYEPIAVHAMNILNQVRCNIGTMSGAGLQIADNDIMNLPYIIHRRGVIELTGLYKNKPAVIVSTGPSLEKNIHHLMDNMDTAIIISVGQALRPLLSFGIKPDFICSVDFGEVNLTHYEGLMETNIPLIALNRSYDGLLKRWKGPMFVSTSEIAEQMPDQDKRIHHLITEKGSTLQGGSVSHMAYGVAVLMGCNPITFVGQDLAYEGDQSHFAQADSGGKISYDALGGVRWDVDDPRCHLHGSGNIPMGPVITIPGYFLKDVKTNTGLSSFIKSFESFMMIKPDGLSVYNSTEGGAHIDGMERISLKRFFERYCDRHCYDLLNKRQPILDKLSFAPNAMELVEEAIPLLQNEIKLLTKIINTSRAGLRSLVKMKKIRLSKNFKKQGDSINKLNRQYKANEKYSTEAYLLSSKLPLVQIAIYSANRKIQQKDMILKAEKRTIEHLQNDIEAFKVRTERNRIILQTVVDASSQLRVSYSKTLKVLTNCHNQRNINLLNPPKKEPEPDISDAEVYFDAGNFARPLLEAKRILNETVNMKTFLDKNDKKSLYDVEDVLKKANKMRDNIIEKARALPDRSDEIDYITLMDKGQNLAGINNDFKGAVKLFEKAHKLYPEGEVGIWGLATVYMHLKRYDKSIKYYKELTKLKPGIPRYRFELGQTLISGGYIQDGVNEIQHAMNKTEDFDSFFAVIGELYLHNPQIQNYDAAKTAFELYLKKFPSDFNVWEKLSEVALHLKDQDLYDKANSEYSKLTGG